MGEKSPKVSIVLPTYNGAKYLRQSIDSCLNQTYKNIELIIVDDGSTDETPKIIKSYNDERIKYIQHEKNKGLPLALNTGFAHASGEYLTWTSDDNYYAEEALEKMLSFIKDKNCDFVYADYCWFNEENPSKLHFVKLPDILELDKHNDVGPCFLYSRQVKESIGDFDPDAECAEDYDYWIRVSKKFTMCHLNENLYYYRQHAKAISIAKFYDVRIASVLVRMKNDLLDLDKAVDALLDVIAQKNPGFFRINRIIAKMIFSKRINKILDDYGKGKISFKDARIVLRDIIGD